MIKQMDVVHASAQLDIDKRREFMQNFANKTMIVSSNVLARAIDLKSLRVVINYDLPSNKKANVVDPKCYLNRMGRCARFGMCTLIAKFR